MAGGELWMSAQHRSMELDNGAIRMSRMGMADFGSKQLTPVLSAKRINDMKRLLTTIMGISLMSLASISFAKDFTIRSYYPSPVGIYNDLRFAPADPDPDCEVGTLQINENHEIVFCKEVGQEISTGEWSKFEEVWQQEEDAIHLINSDAFVGIGITTPQNKLHIYDDSSMGATVLLESAASQFALNVKDHNLSIVDKSAGNVPRLIMNWKADVGIGTSSPEEITEHFVIKTQLSTMPRGKSGQAIHLTKSGSNSGATIGTPPGKNGLMLVSGGSMHNESVKPFTNKYSGIYFNNANTDFFTGNVTNKDNYYDVIPQSKFHINGNGNIGVGTTAPQAGLHVMGDAIIASWAAGWPTRIDASLVLHPRSGDTSTWGAGDTGEINYSSQNNKLYFYNGSSWMSSSSGGSTEKPTFSKCQVFHSAAATYPSCPSGWSGVHTYIDSCVEHVEKANTDNSGKYAGISEKNVGSWCYYSGLAPSEWRRYESTKSCTVCQMN